MKQEEKAELLARWKPDNDVNFRTFCVKGTGATSRVDTTSNIEV